MGGPKRLPNRATSGYYMAVWAAAPMATAEIRSGILNDAVLMGMRASIGVIFILHGVGKFNPGFANALPNMGLPPELQIPIALAEVVPGILIIIGILGRFSGAMLSIVMVGAMVHVKGLGSITGDSGVEFDLILLAASLVVMIAGPGRISLAHMIKRLPRYLH